MSNYEFTITLRDVNSATDELEDRIVEAGCDDALLCFCRDVAYLEFSREASSAEEAISSALKDLKNAGLDAASIQEEG